MKLLLLVLLAGAVLLLARSALAGEIISPGEASKRVESGAAVLIDVREADEWTGGVVKGALLLPLSDLRGPRDRWRPVLETHRDKELILYCRSGNRSGIAARILSAEGFRATNAGGFAAWKEAKQPVVPPP